MKAPAPTYVALDTSTEEQDQPLRRPPTKQEVTVMASALETEGLEEPLTGFLEGEKVRIIDGRVRLRALSKLDTAGRLPLPHGTGRTCIAVRVLNPDAAYHIAARANVRIRPPTSSERIRLAQVLAADPSYKQFVETPETGRPPGPTRAIANLFSLTTEGARLIRRTAGAVPPFGVCQLMATSCDRDSSLKRIGQAVKAGTDVDTAVAAELQGNTMDSHGNRDTGAEQLTPVTAASHAPLHDADAVREFAITLRQRLSPSDRNRFVRALNGRERPGEPRSGALVSRQEVERVRRRIRHAMTDPNLDMTHGALADLAHCGEASISEIVNANGRKRRELITDVDAALDRIGRPYDPPDPDA
ncbi:hypothetical protein [Rhodovibrio salinarum]|uniref:ParB/Sulfiredoxin domain-containing protein n=1 Tax=Rhodovibrio salinarum TaxID=1087 RepID=A0A934QGP6_9PROT|nr:hypothetical protein [Rhodovibrio salinarum]MBK1696676.1 hypothetical protein [Rhodovibrio salinarum]